MPTLPLVLPSEFFKATTFSATCAWQWCHNERDGVSNHQRLDCLLNRLLMHRSKKTPKLRVTGGGNLLVTVEFPAQRASDAENVSNWWRHHGLHSWHHGNSRYSMSIIEATTKNMDKSLALIHSEVVIQPQQTKHNITININTMTSSNGNIFRVTGPLCGEFTGHRWIPRTNASDAELWRFLWSGPDKRLDRQSRRPWFETPSRPLWRHCHDIWGLVCHKQVSRGGTGNYTPQYLWDVITYLCPWYLLLAHKSSYARIYSMHCFGSHITVTLHGHHGVLIHLQLYCLFNRLFRCTSNKTSKLRVTGLCEGNHRSLVDSLTKCFHLTTPSWHTPSYSRDESPNQYNELGGCNIIEGVRWPSRGAKSWWRISGASHGFHDSSSTAKLHWKIKTWNTGSLTFTVRGQDKKTLFVLSALS